MTAGARPTAFAAATLVIGSVVAVDPWGWAPYGPLRWTVVSTGVFVAGALLLLRPIDVNRGTALGWGLFLTWGVIASLAALDPLYTWIGTPDRHLGLTTYGLFAVAFFVGQNVANRDAVRTLLRAAVVALLFVGIYTALEIVGLAPVDLVTASGRPGGPYGSAAYLGAACALLIPVAVGAAADGLGSTGWRNLAVASVAVGVVAALASQTRAGWIGLAAAFAVSLPVAASWMRRHWQPVAAMAIGLMVVALISPVGSRVVAAFDFDDGTTRGRLDEWQIGAAVAVNHPITGVGFEGYRIAFAEGVDADYERRYTRLTMPDRAHNGPLDVAVSTGLLGLALYLVAGGFLVLRAARAVRSGASWLVGIGAGVVGYLAQQWFLFPLAEIDPLFWIFAGVMVASPAEAVPVRFQAPRWVSALVMIAAALALVAGLLDVVADHRVRSAFGELAAGNTSVALEIADDASRLRPDSIRYEFLAAVVAAEPSTPLGYAAAVERLDRALELSPGDPILRAEHASFLLRGAQAAQDEALLDLATVEWEALVTVDPVHARYRLELGNAYAIRGNDAAAEEQWLISADLAPRSITPLVNLAGLMIDQGRRVDAVAVLDRARAIDPDSAEISALQDRLDS